MTEIEIRPMHPDDRSRVVEILACWGMAPVVASAACPDPERSGLEIGRTFVAAAQGRIVGVASFVLLSDRVAVTESLVVDPDWIGKGIGEQLHLTRLAALRTLGIEKVRTEADRPETIAWYVKHFGCRVTGTVPKKHAFGLQGVPDSTVLELDLVPGAVDGNENRN